MHRSSKDRIQFSRSIETWLEKFDDTGIKIAQYLTTGKAACFFIVLAKILNGEIIIFDFWAHWIILKYCSVHNDRTWFRVAHTFFWAWLGWSCDLVDTICILCRRDIAGDSNQAQSIIPQRHW